MAVAWLGCVFGCTSDDQNHLLTNGYGAFAVFDGRVYQATKRGVERDGELIPGGPIGVDSVWASRHGTIWTVDWRNSAVAFYRSGSWNRVTVGVRWNRQDRFFHLPSFVDHGESVHFAIGGTHWSVVDGQLIHVPSKGQTRLLATRRDTVATIESRGKPIDARHFFVDGDRSVDLEGQHFIDLVVLDHSSVIGLTVENEVWEIDPAFQRVHRSMVAISGCSDGRVFGLDVEGQIRELEGKTWTENVTEQLVLERQLSSGKLIIDAGIYYVQVTEVDKPTAPSIWKKPTGSGWERVSPSK